MTYKFNRANGKLNINVLPKGMMHMLSTCGVHSAYIPVTSTYLACLDHHYHHGIIQDKMQGNLR